MTHRQSRRRLSAATLTVAAAIALGGCATQGQSRYSYQDVGRASLVEFGTVLASRPVDITGRNTGAGGLVGATAGGLAMSNVGQGTGNAAAIIGGALVGAVAGAMAEQAMSDRVGIEYTLTLANGKTLTIVQEQAQGDRVFAPGDAVMVQSSGTYQRVLAADHLPAEITRPKEVKIKD
ncbi:outer membrane lipoprotein [Azospirillum sp. A39]|uniref:outer membrane lipoprotein n=1 Tax=Azospirillum sp. A39 TaxID=3462279 RepID=UPI0040463AF6